MENTNDLFQVLSVIGSICSILSLIFAIVIVNKVVKINNNISHTDSSTTTNVQDSSVGKGVAGRDMNINR